MELHPLGELIDGKPALDVGLFAPSSRSAHIMVFRPSAVDGILTTQSHLAQKWAARVSTPRYMHSADGSNRLRDDWSVVDALRILRPLGDIAKKVGSEERFYLLLEW